MSQDFSKSGYPQTTSGGMTGTSSDQPQTSGQSAQMTYDPTVQASINQPAPVAQSISSYSGSYRQDAPPSSTYQQGMQYQQLQYPAEQMQYQSTEQLAQQNYPAPPPHPYAHVTPRQQAQLDQEQFSRHLEQPSGSLDGPEAIPQQQPQYQQYQAQGDQSLGFSQQHRQYTMSQQVGYQEQPQEYLEQGDPSGYEMPQYASQPQSEYSQVQRYSPELPLPPPDQPPVQYSESYQLPSPYEVVGQPQPSAQYQDQAQPQYGDEYQSYQSEHPLPAYHEHQPAEFVSSFQDLPQVPLSLSHVDEQQQTYPSQQQQQQPSPIQQPQQGQLQPVSQYQSVPSAAPSSFAPKSPSPPKFQAPGYQVSPQAPSQQQLLQVPSQLQQGQTAPHQLQNPPQQLQALASRSPSGSLTGVQQQAPSHQQPQATQYAQPSQLSGPQPQQYQSPQRQLPGQQPLQTGLMPMRPPYMNIKPIPRVQFPTPAQYQPTLRSAPPLPPRRPIPDVIIPAHQRIQRQPAPLVVYNPPPVPVRQLQPQQRKIPALAPSTYQQQEQQLLQQQQQRQQQLQRQLDQLRQLQQEYEHHRLELQQQSASGPPQPGQTLVPAQAQRPAVATTKAAGTVPSVPSRRPPQYEDANLAKRPPQRQGAQPQAASQPASTVRPIPGAKPSTTIPPARPDQPRLTVRQSLRQRLGIQPQVHQTPVSAATQGLLGPQMATPVMRTQMVAPVMGPQMATPVAGTQTATPVVGTQRALPTIVETASQTKRPHVRTQPRPQVVDAQVQTSIPTRRLSYQESPNPDSQQLSGESSADRSYRAASSGPQSSSDSGPVNSSTDLMRPVVYKDRVPEGSCPEFVVGEAIRVQDSRLKRLKAIQDEQKFLIGEIQKHEQVEFELEYQRLTKLQDYEDKEVAERRAKLRQYLYRHGLLDDELTLREQRLHLIQEKKQERNNRELVAKHLGIIRRRQYKEIMAQAEERRQLRLLEARARRPFHLPGHIDAFRASGTSPRVGDKLKTAPERYRPSKNKYTSDCYSVYNPTRESEKDPLAYGYSEKVFSYCEGDVWALISYNERDVQIAGSYVAKLPRLIVDGFTYPDTADRFCLGVRTQHQRNVKITQMRSQIGQGLIFQYLKGDLFVQSLMKVPLFISDVTDPSDNYRNIVIKLQPGATRRIFSVEAFMELLCFSYMRGHDSLRALLDRACVKMSFIKGWGPQYRRKAIEECELWLSVRLIGPQQMVLKAINTLRRPRSVSPTEEPVSDKHQPESRPEAAQEEAMQTDIPRVSSV